MRITMDLFYVFCYLIFVRSASAKLFFKVSRKGPIATALNKAIPRELLMSEDNYPQPLPTQKPKTLVMSPRSLFQGLRYANDTRVFRKRFDHEAKMTGQQLLCQGIFDCLISHIAIESSEAIPVLLRGGAGYRHFMAIIKAKPYKDLRGQVRVYCRNNYGPVREPEKPINGRRRFFLGDRLNENEETWT